MNVKFPEFGNLGSCKNIFLFLEDTDTELFGGKGSQCQK